MRRVIKFGGSLFDLPGLAAKLHTWFDHQPAAENLIIVGGGEFVECLRRIDQLHELTELDAHWLAIEAMSLTARLLSRLTALPIAITLQMPRVPLPVILDVAACLAADGQLRAQFQSDLPASWQSTSDSIAAFFAQHWLAHELVLFKSTLPANACSCYELAASGVVDRHFPRAASRLSSIRVVDFRSSNGAEIRISPAGGA